MVGFGRLSGWLAGWRFRWVAGMAVVAMLVAIGLGWWGYRDWRGSGGTAISSRSELGLPAVRSKPYPSITPTTLPVMPASAHGAAVSQPTYKLTLPQNWRTATATDASQEDGMETCGALFQPVSGTPASIAVCGPYPNSGEAPDQLAERYRTLWKADEERTMVIDGHAAITQEYTQGPYAAAGYVADVTMPPQLKGISPATGTLGVYLIRPAGKNVDARTMQQFYQFLGTLTFSNH